LSCCNMHDTIFSTNARPLHTCASSFKTSRYLHIETKHKRIAPYSTPIPPSDSLVPAYSVAIHLYQYRNDRRRPSHLSDTNHTAISSTTPIPQRQQGPITTATHGAFLPVILHYPSTRSDQTPLSASTTPSIVITVQLPGPKVAPHATGRECSGYMLPRILHAHATATSTWRSSPFPIDSRRV
jgi:hypothetical protein